VQDIIMRVENFPAPGQKISASEFIITGGGCAANAAVAIARLNGRAAFAGPLGGAADDVSNRIVADLVAEGIDCGGAVRVEGGTASVSLILLDAEGEKTIATRRGGKLGNGLPADAARLVPTPTPCWSITGFPNSSRRFAAPRMRGRFRSLSISIWRPKLTIRSWRSAPT
jgi:sulfofructose kinase